MISKVIKCINGLLQQAYMNGVVVNFQWHDEKELLQVEYGEVYHVEVVLIYGNWIKDSGKVDDDVLLKIYKAIEIIKFS
jgi:hypothetical protein